MKFKLHLFFSLLLFVIISSESCKKTEEVEDFLLCPECTNEEISGNYFGDGMYFTDDNPEVSENLDANLNISHIEAKIHEISVDIPNKFSASYFVTRDDGSASMTISGTSKSINITIYKKDNEYKINGTAKVYHTKADTVFIDHSVSFTVYK